jgi:hypothetical protein
MLMPTGTQARGCQFRRLDGAEVIKVADVLTFPIWVNKQT